MQQLFGPEQIPRIQNRPLVGFALTQIFGVVAGIYFVLPSLFMLHAASLLILIALFVRRSRAASLLLFFSAALLSAYTSGISLKPLTDVAPQMIVERARERVALDGNISSDPVRNPRGWSFSLNAEKLKRRTDWQETTGRVSVFLYDTDHQSSPSYGDRVQITGTLYTGDAQGRPPRFRSNVRDLEKISEREGSAFVSWCYQRRKACGALLEQGITDYPLESSVLKALMLGYRSELPDETEQLFKVTGTFHVFAISGLHVGILAVLVVGLLSAIGIPRNRWFLVVGPILIAYAVMTGLKASVIRAVIMALCYVAAVPVSRKPDIINALALSSIIVLSADPLQLLNPGFVFSFTVVIGLVLFSPLLYKGCLSAFGWNDRDLILKAASPFRNVGTKFTALLVTSIVAWLFSAPLSAYFFNIVTPAAIMGNLFVIPASYVIVLTGTMSLIVGGIAPPLGEVFNHANRLFIHWIVGVVDRLAELPYAHFYVESPEAMLVYVFYGLLLSLLLIRLRSALVLALLVLVVGYGVHDRRNQEPKMLHVLDAGRGTAVLYESDRLAVMIDAGPRYVARSTLGYLRKRGVNHIDVMILTHADVAHIGAVLDVIEQIPIRQIWISPALKGFKHFSSIRELSEQHGVEVVERASGDRGVWVDGTHWEILHPLSDASRSRRAADHTLILRISNGTSSVLFMGGADQRVENHLGQLHIEPAATVLIAGDHASRGVCSDEWLSLVGPTQIVVSAGASSMNGNPDGRVLRRIERKSIPLWRTDEDGHYVREW